MRVGAQAWSSSVLSSGSRDKNIFQRDIRAQDDYVSKLTGHKSEVRPDNFTVLWLSSLIGYSYIIHM